MFRASSLCFAPILYAAMPLVLHAAEYPIGEPKVFSGMEVAAVYLQPIEMDPPGMMLPADRSDIHLEADIHATETNKNGFAEGDWVPNLGRLGLPHVRTVQRSQGRDPACVAKACQ